MMIYKLDAELKNKEEATGMLILSELLSNVVTRGERNDVTEAQLVM